jgi:hypothetical protein
MKIFAYIFPLIQILFGFGLAAQTIRGIVTDASSGERLPYVNIGVYEKNMGVISMDDGKFEIDLSKAAPEDQLVFSMMGYESMTVNVAEVKDFMEVRMRRKTYNLPEVVVSQNKNKPEKIGRYQPSKVTTGHGGSREFGLGGERGLKILHGDKKYWVEQVAFHTRFNTLDSILFRVRIYNIENDLPKDNLLQRDLFVKSYKKDKWIVKDLSSENFILNEDVIVTFEVVRLWFSDTGENHLFFTHGIGYEEGKTYTRASSFDKWSVNAPGAFPVAMYLSVTEY